MWTPVYFVRLVPFPPSVDGVTVPNDDGTFDVYINASHCEAKQKEALDHEIRHIFEDHFYQDTKSIERLEAEARGSAQVPAQLPNVFRDAPANTIPFFSSLDSFRDYLFAMRDQTLGDKSRQAAG